MSEDVTLDEFIESESTEPTQNELARKTVCGIPPKDWSVARLGEVVDVVSGNSLPNEYQDESGGEHPVYKVSDMNETGNEKYVTASANRLDGDELEELNHTLYPKQTTILPKVGAALLTNKRRLLTEPSSFDNNVMGWVPDEINPEFLYYVSCMIDMEAVAQKGAVPSISKAIAKSLKVPSPPLSEQRKIATVLHNVDQAIQKTEEITNQISRLKKGVAQDLFRTGLDGEETKDTWLGEVPKEWEIVRFRELIESSRNGVYKKEEAYGGETPILKMGDMFEEMVFEAGDMERLEMEDDEIEKYRLKEGDLLFARRSLNVEGAGECTLIGNLNEPTVFESSLIRVRLKQNCVPMFYAQYFEGPVGSKSVERIVTTTTASGIAGSDLKNLLVPKPKKEIQRKIGEILSLYDTREAALEQERERLTRLKKGLMQDLLSGTVRTTDTNIEVPEEVAQHG